MALWPLYGKGCLHRHTAGWQILQTSTKYKHRCKKHTRTHTRLLRGVGWRTRAISQECHPLQLHPCSPFTHSLTRLIVHARLKGRNPCTVFYYFFPPSNWSWSSLLQVPASQSGIQHTRGFGAFKSESTHWNWNVPIDKCIWNALLLLSCNKNQGKEDTINIRNTRNTWKVLSYMLLPLLLCAYARWNYAELPSHPASKNGLISW